MASEGLTNRRRLLLTDDAGRVDAESWRPQPLSAHRREFPAAGACGLIEEIDRAGLRGRGGAAFPTATKWRSVAGAGRPGVVVANGEEGEPLSFKDRYLLLRRPHLVLDGLLLAREALGAARAIVYVSSAAGRAAVERALDERADADVEVVCVEPAYVAGEETAVVAAIEGDRPVPRAKPPRPDQAGVDGLPTLVQNVETLAHVAWIRRHGAEAFRAAGTPEEPGTFLVTVGRAGGAPFLHEAEAGLTLAEVLAPTGIDPRDVRAVLAGGYFGGLLTEDAVHGPLSDRSLRALGSGLGCAAFTVLGHDDCPVEAAAAVLRYFARASSGQCGSCVRGTAAMADAVERLRDGEADDDDVANLRRWSAGLRGRGACALLDGAATAAASLLTNFAEVVDDHRAGTCARCARARSAAGAVVAPDAATTRERKERR
jgi:NADH:ubiquinone oxidoreductase subunit F (NADH-binding)